MSVDPRLRTPNKEVWQMDAVEKLAEGLRRKALLLDHLIAQKAKFRTDGPTVIVETTLNNYFVDFADDDPRFVTLQTIYEIDQLSPIFRAAAGEATAQSFGAKALIGRVESGYRLRFIAEIVAGDVSGFLSAIGLHQALVEDCREKFLKYVEQLSSD